MAQLESTPSDAAFSLSSVYTYWKEFDLDGRRTKLDEIGLKVASLQEQSTHNRKRLADSTRDFKRSTAAHADSELAIASGNLLKQYQEEIDGLTRRAKYGETAFLDLYEQLFEAPDPSHALAVALDNEVQLVTLSTTVAKVSAELAEYKVESRAIKNQDLTIRKQEEAVRELAAALEAKDQELQASKQQAAAEADAAVLQRMQARESELTEMLNSAQSSLEAMQRLYTAAQNQLFELQSTREEAVAGRQEEYDIAAAELEAVQGRLLALEAQKDNLQAKLESSRQEAAAAAAHGSSSVEDTLRQELDSQREVSARLRQDLAAARQQQHEAEAQWEQRYIALEDQLASQQAANQQLQHELQLRPTAAQLLELQQQIRALQAVGYGSVDDDPSDVHNTAVAADHTVETAAGSSLSEGVTPTGPAAAAVRSLSISSSSGLNIESMLLSKNRRLEHDVTMARLAVAEASQQLEAAREQMSDLQDQLQQKQELISRLEDDLLAVRQGSAPAAAAGNYSSSDAAAAAAAASPHSPAAVMSSADTGNNNIGLSNGTDGADSHMLRVVIGQRDRLRSRVQDLEVQLANIGSDLQTAQQQLAAARSDNVALIERLRYVGGYRQQAAAARSNAAAGGKGGDLESGGDVVGKYSRLYDDGINPFKQFQGQQQEQKRKQMSISDKAMYSVGSLVYQSPAARLLAFGYIVILHLLVFGSLTHMTHRTSSHLIDHQELLLQHGRHDLTGLMHASGDAAVQSVAAAIGLSPSPGVG